jgi:hypothetical protein
LTVYCHPAEAQRVPGADASITCTIENKTPNLIELMLECSGLEGTGIGCSFNGERPTGKTLAKEMSDTNFSVIGLPLLTQLSYQVHVHLLLVPNRASILIHARKRARRATVIREFLSFLIIIITTALVIRLDLYLLKSLIGSSNFTAFFVNVSGSFISDKLDKILT